MSFVCMYVIITIIIIIGTTAPFEPRPSSEASASCPYSLQHSSNFSPPNFLASSITPSSHLSFALPLCLLPSVMILICIRIKHSTNQFLRPKLFHTSSYFGQSGHCFFGFRNNIFSGAGCQPYVQPQQSWRTDRVAS